MNSNLVAVAFVSGLTVLTSVAEAQQATVIKEKDQAVSATIASFDVSGCFETDVVVLGTLGMTKQVPGNIETVVPFASVNVTVINTCFNDNVVSSLSGSTETINLQVDQNLSLATLQATVPMYNNVDQSFAFNSTVDLVFTATAVTVTSKDNDIQKTSGLIVVSHMRGSIRDASPVRGIVTDANNNNYNQGAGSAGVISQLTSGSVTIVQR
jgi:hypothetical protein